MPASSLLHRLVPDLSVTLFRFPVPALISVLMFIYVMMDIQRIDLFFISNDKDRVYLAGLVSFLASGGMHLVAESKNWSRICNIAGAVSAAMLVSILVWLEHPRDTGVLFILCSAFLWLTISAFITRRARFNAFWLFNARLFLAIILATIVGIVFAAGLSAIIASIEHLFDVDIPGRAYGHIWGTGVTLVGPVYGLSLIPASFDEQFDLTHGDDILRRGISVLINYILVPVLLIYALILHAYAIKIGLTFKLPKGQIGIMVLLYGLAGTATWLIARPWVENGTRLLKFFTRFWFWFTVIPVALLALAIRARIAAYGVTPERYGLVLIGLWMFLTIIYFAFRRLQARPQVILGILAIMLLAGSFGPWGAERISVLSQLHRLQQLMELWGITENGKIASKQPSREDVPAQVLSNGNSIVTFLRRHDALEQLRPLFAGHPKDPFKVKYTNTYILADNINKVLGFKNINTAAGDSKSVNFHSSGSLSQTIPASRILHGPFSLYRKTTAAKQPDTANKVYINLGKDMLVARHNGRQWQINHGDLLEKTVNAKNGGNPLPVAIKPAGGGQAAILIVTAISGRRGKQKAIIHHLSGWLLIPATP